MKAAELRIGNWYYSMTIGGHWIESQVKDGKHLDVLDGCSIDEAKPIPLTEEWLERFGFKQIPETNRFYLDDKNTPQTIYIDLTEKDTMFGSNEEYDVSPCLNVHQLQNLYFALTGQELTLTK